MRTAIVRSPDGIHQHWAGSELVRRGISTYVDNINISPFNTFFFLDLIATAFAYANKGSTVKDPLDSYPSFIFQKAMVRRADWQGVQSSPRQGRSNGNIVDLGDRGRLC